jgi:hypothetical protein
MFDLEIDERPKLDAVSALPPHYHTGIQREPQGTASAVDLSLLRSYVS